jgi:hypothetical protein
MRLAKLKDLYAKPKVKASAITFAIFANIILLCVLAYNYPLGMVVVMACIVVLLMVILVWFAIYDTVKRSLH